MQSVDNNEWEELSTDHVCFIKELVSDCVNLFGLFLLQPSMDVMIAVGA